MLIVDSTLNVRMNVSGRNWSIIRYNIIFCVVNIIRILREEICIAYGDVDFPFELLLVLKFTVLWV